MSGSHHYQSESSVMGDDSAMTNAFRPSLLSPTQRRPDYMYFEAAKGWHG